MVLGCNAPPLDIEAENQRREATTKRLKEASAELDRKGKQVSEEVNKMQESLNNSLGTSKNLTPNNSNKNSFDLAKELAKLEKWKKDGLITDEEFQALRKKAIQKVNE